jgi:ATP-binding cassette, subfamily B, multidrug efflux pump
MSIHADAFKETSKGSFGYSDWFLYKNMFSYTKLYRKELAIVFAHMIVFTITTAVGPLILLYSVDRFSANQPATFGIPPLDYLTIFLAGVFRFLFPNLSDFWAEVAVIALYYLLVQVIMFWVSYRQSYLLGEIAQKVVLQIRNEQFEYLQELDMGYHDRNEVGRIMSRTTGDVQAIGMFIGGQVVQNLVNIITILVVFIIMIRMNLYLSFVSISLIIPVVLISNVAKNYARPRRKESRRRNSILMATLGENIAGIKVTKGFNREPENVINFDGVNTEYKNATIRAIDVNAYSFPTMLFLAALSNGVIIFFGGRLLLEGAITAGMLLAFLNYNTILFRPIVILGNFYEQIQDALTGAERVYALLDTKTTIPLNEHLPDLPPIEGNVKFENILFEYVPGTPVYSNFNLDIQAGMKVAFVGHTGAGKTTIINILTRLYEFQEGNLFIDGYDIRKFNLKSYRDQIAAVPQDFFLFSKGIKENLKLGNPMATEEQMWDALDKVGLKRYVERLPEGLDTPVQERGGRLSIGQRQLVVFASVLLADPRILILDEATSSIDVFTEIQIQKAVKVLLEKRTSFIIAHRLSTVRDADHICVIEEGQIVEQGTHEELLEKNGYYFELVKNQLELAETVT